MKRLVTVLVTVLLLATFAAPTVSAAAVAQQAGGDDNFPYLFAAYTVVWLALIGYLFIMSRRQRELEREVKALRRALEDQQAGARQPSPEEGG